MNSPIKTTPSYSTSVRGRVDDSGEMRADRCPISYRVGYINHLPADACVSWRLGAKVVIPRETKFHPEFEFIVTVDIDISPGMRSKFEEFLSTVGETASDELKFVREAYVKACRSATLGFLTLRLDYPVTLETLKSHGGSVYLYEVDTVVSLNNLRDAPPHPYSDFGIHSNLAANSDLAGDSKKFSISLEIVDNLGRIGDRYINVLNQVYRIEPKRDLDRKDGVYQVGNAPTDNSKSKPEIIVSFCNIEDAETKYKLYRSYEEARDLGDETRQQKLEAAELEKQLLVIRSETQQKKAEHERDSIELDRQKQQAQIDHDELLRKNEKLRDEEKNRLEMQRIYHKDVYEMRSTQRKDDSEVMKHIPTIILGAGAIFMAFSKFFAK